MKKAVNLNGYTELILTKLDVLTGLETVKMCVAYELDGERIDYPPSLTEDLERCVPVYGENSGWDEPIGDIRNFYELPINAREYIDSVEKITRVPVSYVSVGPERDQTVKVDINRQRDLRCNLIMRQLY